MTPKYNVRLARDGKQQIRTYSAENVYVTPSGALLLLETDSDGRSHCLCAIPHGTWLGVTQLGYGPEITADVKRSYTRKRRA